ncbi:uncharacterized protein LOC142575934 isoform X5 [Dermacentor variabilis]|uniref:uncharacterized protein LOC142575934 isoform X5 n=1 Tax=Dermacentor variabilis TaxID=34621 RepID=UPI003F5C9417
MGNSIIAVMLIFGSLATGTIIEDIKKTLDRLREMAIGRKVLQLPKIDVDVYIDADHPLAVNFSRCPFETDLCIVECYNKNKTKPIRGHCGGILWFKCVCEGDYKK